MAATQYERILQKFRNQAHFCAVIGMKQSTVGSWKESGLIPSKHIGAIIAKANAANIGLTALDFFPAPAVKQDRKRGRAA